MQRIMRINDSEIKSIMHNGAIQSVSIASGKTKDDITAIPFAKIDRYGAASLSKPVFTYLVLKLIGLKEDFKLNTELNRIYPFEDFCKKHNIKWENSSENSDRIKQFTPAMVLSHMTGLPIGYNPASGAIQFDFEPGKGFGYSGLHLMYLQDCLEKKYGPLEELAKKYVFIPASMDNTNFNHSQANAANSLHTTAEDYVKFCIHWLQDPNQLIQSAFEIKVSMLNDPWAVREGISKKTLSHLAWGYGWGLEKNDDGVVVNAFHTGDMGEWRAGVKLDLIDKSVKVFFSKSSLENGHLLQEKVFGQSYALDYFFDKYKFARTLDELKDDWREKPSYGLRKELIINKDKRMNSTASILEVVSANSTAKVPQQTVPLIPNTITKENSSQESVTKNPQQEIEQNPHKTPTPCSSNFTPTKNK